MFFQKKKISALPIETLVDTSTGKVRTGRFDAPVLRINYKDFDLRSPYGHRKGNFSKSFSYNRFEFLGAVSEDLVFGTAAAGIGFLNAAFVYFFQPSSGKFFAKSFKNLLSSGISFSDLPEEGCTIFKSGNNRIEMRGGNGKKNLLVSLASGESIDAIFHEDSHPQSTLRICTKTGPTGWVFVRKTAAIRVTGKAVTPFGEIDLGLSNSMGHNDYSQGYMRRETYWNWACFSYNHPKYGPIGLNLSNGVNETGFSENTLWLKETMTPLAQAEFFFDKDHIMEEWSVRTNDGSVNLRFSPMATHKENVNAILVGSSFNQIIGRFSGEIRVGRKIFKLDNILGFCEDHFAKW